MDKKSFFEKYLPYAQLVEKKYSVPVSVTLAQAAIESSWGESGLTKKANGFFGIKANKGWDGQIYTSATKEEASGKTYTTVAAFRKYSSDLDSFLDYGNFLTSNSRYSNAFKTKNSYDFGSAVASAGYATSSSYTKMMHDIMRQNNLTQYDGTGGSLVGDFVEGSDSGSGSSTPGRDAFDNFEMNTGNKFLDFLGNLGAKVTDSVTDDETGELDLDIDGKVQTLKTGFTKSIIILILVIVVILAVFLAIKSGGVTASA